MEVRIPYSKDQFDAKVNNRLYGHPYGMQAGTDKYVKLALEVLGYSGIALSTDLDDKTEEFIVTIPEDTPTPSHLDMDAKKELGYAETRRLSEELGIAWNPTVDLINLRRWVDFHRRKPIG